MWIFLNFVIAVGINFGVPEISITEKSVLNSKNCYSNFGYPFQYHAFDYLTDQQVNSRIYSIYIHTLLGVSLSGPLVSPGIIPTFPWMNPIIFSDFNSINQQTEINYKTVEIINRRP